MNKQEKTAKPQTTKDLDDAARTRQMFGDAITPPKGHVDVVDALAKVLGALAGLFVVFVEQDCERGIVVGAVRAESKNGRGMRWFAPRSSVRKYIDARRAAGWPLAAVMPTTTAATTGRQVIRGRASIFDSADAVYRLSAGKLTCVKIRNAMAPDRNAP